MNDAPYTESVKLAGSQNVNRAVERMITYLVNGNDNDMRNCITELSESIVQENEDRILQMLFENKGGDTDV